jgi:hypothetical protein
MGQQADALLDAFQKAIVGRSRNAFAELCAIDVHYEDPFSVGPIKGIGPMADHIAQLWAAAPDAQTETSGARLDGGRFICAPMRLAGTHTGDVGDLPATGKRFDTQVLFYCELDADRTRLWRIRAFIDSYDLAVQLGVLPSRGGAADKALMVLRGFGLRVRRD